MHLDLPQVNSLSERRRCEGRSWNKRKWVMKSQDQRHKLQVDLFCLWKRLNLIWIMWVPKNCLWCQFDRLFDSPLKETVLIWLDGLNTEMNVDELNSKNAVCRVGVSPKLKELTCILCIESLWNSSLPGRLLPDQAKSPARVSELWKSLSAQSWEKKAVGQKLFVKSLPEATKTWWQVVSAIYVCFWMARCEIFKGFSLSLSVQPSRNLDH